MELHWVSLCLPVLRLLLSVCVCGLITFCFRCLSVHAQRPRGNHTPLQPDGVLQHRTSEGKYAFLCLLAGLAVLIFYRTALHSEALFPPSPNPLPPLNGRPTETIVDSSVWAGCLAGKIAIFAKKKPRKRLGKLFDMLSLPLATERSNEFPSRQLGNIPQTRRKEEQGMEEQKKKKQLKRA